MIKKMLVVVSLVGSLGLVPTFAAPAGAATGNGSRLSQCERSAAERLARRLQGSGDRTRARQQFNNDIARCKRRFG
ncbi:MAG: hypothetical protein JO054_16455 [Actinobacteria bacterium]|nr:hypothetical protein [Actinomycetota bacterium]MBV9255825.1 hypothetical protein [Actinomycetota bacterium]